MRKFNQFLFAAAMTCCAAGCSNSDSNNTSTPSNSKAAVDVQMTETALTATDVPAVNAQDAQTWGDHLNAFGFDFMHKLNEQSNLVYSPFSLHSALSMVACGANGKTLEEIADVLHVEKDVTKIAKDNGAMSVNLRFDGQTEGSKFEIANRIWVDQTAEVVPSFKTLMNDQFKAPLQIVNFIEYAADVVDIINQWVSNVTNKMIKNLLNNSDVTDDTRMVLVNAIHFDGEWETKFEKNNTYDQDFLVNGTDKKTVQMMHNTTEVNYYEATDYQAIVMPYKGDKFSMIFILPNENDKLANVASTLSDSDVRQIMKDAKAEEVAISLPQFKIEYSMTNAVGTLNAMGIQLAFTNGADFSQMISNEGVHIGKVIHKAVIEVDEEGTRAAAATAIVMEKNGVAMDAKTFRADHPFAFALVHNGSNGILFAGQYVGK